MDLLDRTQFRISPASSSSGIALEPLSERVNASLFALVTRWPDGFKGTDLDPELTRGKMEKLVAKVEKLLPAEAAEPAKNLSPAELLARQWRDALAANTMGVGASRQAEDARQRAAEQEVQRPGRMGAHGPAVARAAQAAAGSLRLCRSEVPGDAAPQHGAFVAASASKAT